MRYRCHHLALGAIAVLSTTASPLAAQVPAAELQIAGAVSAAPEGLRANATVIGYTNYHRMATLREGSNEMICLADDPSEPRWQVACYHKDLEPFMVKGRELRATGADPKAIEAGRLAAIEAGTLKMPDGPRVLYNLFASGDSVDAATGLAHGTTAMQSVYIPYATAESTGLPARPGNGLPWIMYPGKPWAHIMLMR
ncbi:MAG: hypothetical protein ABI587_12540 [Gemmatimonadales bacterium]